VVITLAVTVTRKNRPEPLIARIIKLQKEEMMLWKP